MSVGSVGCTARLFEGAMASCHRVLISVSKRFIIIRGLCSGFRVSGFGRFTMT